MKMFCFESSIKSGGFLKSFVPFLFLVLLASGCAPTCYLPPEIDQQTGYYTTETVVAPDAVQKFDANVDLKRFSFVYLKTSTSYWPARFEFFVRAALVRMGFSHILNSEELSAFITSNPQLSSIPSLNESVGQQRLSELVGPVLHIEMNVRSDGDARHHVTLSVTDFSSGDALLLINHNRLVQTTIDGEAHYPVLNELRKWTVACKKGGTI